MSPLASALLLVASIPAPPRFTAGPMLMLTVLGAGAGTVAGPIGATLGALFLGGGGGFLLTWVLGMVLPRPGGPVIG